MTDEDEAAKFWSDFERSTGEKVVCRSIGEYYESSSDVGVWGILVLTDLSFHFKRMPNDNWLSSLFRGFASRRTEAPKEDIVIPRAAMVSVEAPRRGFVARLFGPAFPRVSVSVRGDGGEASYLFSADPATGIVAELLKASPSA